MNSAAGVCGFLLVAACFCFSSCQSESHSQSQFVGSHSREGRHETLVGDTRKPAAVFSGDPVESGARSAYQLAPFGEGFGFADLFSLFGHQQETKQQQSGDGFPFQLSENLISSGLVDDQTPVIVGANNNNNKNQKSSTARRLNLGAWNRILLANRKVSPSSGGGGEETKLNQSRAGAIEGLASPIILVPGYGGSRLEAKLDKPSSVHYFCDSKTENWNDLWINVKQLLPYMIDCLIDNMRLEFDPSTNQTRNPAGVDIRVKNGSQVASVEYLNNLQISGFAYFAPIIEQLSEGKLGYERELSIRAAPYDFRKAPNELGDYFDNLKESSEQLVRDRAGQRVTFICHSMGCNNMLYFLHRQTDQWKAKHVRRLISVAAPWAGSVSAMRAAAVGDDLGMPYLFSESKLLLVQRSLPSTIFLFPHKQAYAGIPLVRTQVADIAESIPKKLTDSSEQQQSTNSDIKNPAQPNDDLVRSSKSVEKSSNNEFKHQSMKKQQSVYTADDFKQFFEDINHLDGYRMWLNTKDLLGSLEAPGVEVWCLVGVGKQTLARIDYVGDFPTSASQELYDDGDGTVTIQSADYCKKWSQEQQQPVYYRQFESDHLAILKNDNVLRYIERILESDLAS